MSSYRITTSKNVVQYRKSIERERGKQTRELERTADYAVTRFLARSGASRAGRPCYRFFRRRIHANPAAAPVAMTITAAGPVSVTGLPTGGCRGRGSIPFCASSGGSSAFQLSGTNGRLMMTDAMVGGRTSDALRSVRQKRSHPSPSLRLPSSHCSLLSRIASPHRKLLQFVRQRSGSESEFSSPRSHSSPGSTSPLPQKSDMKRQSAPQP